MYPQSINMGKERYGYLLKDKDIERWKHSVDSGSRITGDVYLRRLGSFCMEMRKTPQELLKMKDKALADLIDDYIFSTHLPEEAEGVGDYFVILGKGQKPFLETLQTSFPEGGPRKL